MKFLVSTNILSVSVNFHYGLGWAGSGLYDSIMQKITVYYVRFHISGLE